jgi:bleomycin hydrolase
MKRARENISGDIDQEFLDQCEKRFREDPSNSIVRNAVISAGSTLTSTDSNRLNKVSHIFMNSIKKKDLKATNQGHSGRCWMFAGLNMFRHNILKAMDLENFEFSETYLFFYDKLERCNTFLHWIIDNLDSKPGNRDFDYTMENSLQDGGWWNCFANLVNKYGLIPQDAMKETWHSSDSEEMNDVVQERLHATANWIRKNRKLPREELLQIKNDTVADIYTILVKFLGEPPKKFRWSYTNEEGVSNIIDNLTPKIFLDIVLPDIDLHDFISLSNIPGSRYEYNKMYSINQTNNVYEGGLCTVLNLPIHELGKYAMNSILAGMPVWFIGDVSKNFHPWHSTLDDQLLDDSTVFGPVHKFDKGERIDYFISRGTHAMTLTGVNINHKGIPEDWQVENSWGYLDYETPGEDGWLAMSNSWFKKNVMEVVVHKNFLSRTVQRQLDQDPVMLDPWDSLAPAIRAGCIDAPKSWEKLKQHSSYS